ncbi:protein of unknown function [Pararobbsia alpina]|jgi:hypothetical protein|uniref:hypothetical protein n=1 Tax=Pararobbsia alpina TaxID=621374 RepID=UPI0039A755C8
MGALFASDRSVIDMLNEYIFPKSEHNVSVVEIVTMNYKLIGRSAVEKLIRDLRMHRVQEFQLRDTKGTARFVVNYFGD